MDLGVAIDGSGNIEAVWQGTDSSTGGPAAFVNRYTAGTGWGIDTVLNPSAFLTSASSPQVGFDQNGNAIAAWLADGRAYVSRYNKTTNAWSSPQNVATRTDAVSKVNLKVDASGNAIVAWIQSDGTSNSVWVSRYSASANTWSTAQTIETNTAAASNASAAINASGQAVVAWLQTASGPTPPIKVYASRYVNGAWQTPALLETNANTVSVPPAVALDASGNVQVVWQQSDGTAQSIYFNRFSNGTGSYVVPSGANWQTVANTLNSVNSVAAGDALRVAMNNVSLAGATLTNLPSMLSVTTTQTVTVPAYYVVPSNPNWPSIANALYGVNTTAAGDALKTALGRSTTPTAGERLTGLPGTLTVTTTQSVTVPAYYLVPANATWPGITQTVYGTSDANAVAALQAATGPTLQQDLHLVVPSTLTYTPSGATSTGPTLYLQTDVAPLGV